VVDDGSATPLEIEERIDSHAPVRVLRSSENIGLAAARNRALENIEADWILYVDSDVLPFESFLENLPQRLQTTDADGFGFHVREYHRRSDWDLFRACERDAVTMAGPVEWISGLLCAYRVTALRALKGFDATFRSNGEDVDLGYRLTRAGKSLVHVPEVCGEHHRQDTLRSFLRMCYRYALTAKRVDRSFYFSTSNAVGKPPLFHLGSVGPQIRLMLQFVVRRPHALYLLPLILGAMFCGAHAGRQRSRVARRGAIDQCRA